MATSGVAQSDEVEKLVSELIGLVPSAASDEALATCRLLSQLAGPAGPRDVLDRAIDHLRTSQGRTSDGERRNYAFATVAAALDAALGPSAADFGLEERYQAVAEAMGNTNSISGRRALPRLARHLALAILVVSRADGSIAAPSRRAEVLVGEETSPLLADVDQIDDLLAMAIARRLAAQRAWRGALASAIAAAYKRDPTVGAAAVERLLDGELDREADPETRLGIHTVLLIVSCDLASSPPWTAVCAEQALDVLQSPQISAQLPPSATSTREDAAVALDRASFNRPGTGMHHTEDAEVPQHRFVRLPGRERTTLLSVYPTTIAQYRCFNPNYVSVELSPSHPAVGVTCGEAEAYCSWIAPLLIRAPDMELLQPSGRTTSLATKAISDVGLPTRGQILAAGRAEHGMYAWSHAIDSKIGLQRRRSYQRILPVGLFPDEPSSAGALDLYGLIWQWTADDWDGKPAGYRAVFGGGYEGAERFLQVGQFLGAAPNTRRRDRGFRIAVVTRST